MKPIFQVAGAVCVLVPMQVGALQVECQTFGPGFVFTAGMDVTSHECPICLVAFQKGDKVAQMHPKETTPEKKHLYHRYCIVRSLMDRPACPNCKEDVLSNYPIAEFFYHVKNSNVEGVQRFLNSPAGPFLLNAKDPDDGQSVLKIALSSPDNIEVVTLMAEKAEELGMGFDPNSCFDEASSDVLSMLIGKLHKKVVSKLLYNFVSQDPTNKNIPILVESNKCTEVLTQATSKYFGAVESEHKFWKNIHHGQLSDARNHMQTLSRKIAHTDAMTNNAKTASDCLMELLTNLKEFSHQHAFDYLKQINSYLKDCDDRWCQQLELCKTNALAQMQCKDSDIVKPAVEALRVLMKNLRSAFTAKKERIGHLDAFRQLQKVKGIVFDSADVVSAAEVTVDGWKSSAQHEEKMEMFNNLISLSKLNQDQVYQILVHALICEADDAVSALCSRFDGFYDASFVRFLFKRVSKRKWHKVIGFLFQSNILTPEETEHLRNSLTSLLEVAKKSENKSHQGDTKLLENVVQLVQNQVQKKLQLASGAQQPSPSQFSPSQHLSTLEPPKSELQGAPTAVEKAHSLSSATRNQQPISSRPQSRSGQKSHGIWSQKQPVQVQVQVPSGPFKKQKRSEQEEGGSEYNAQQTSNLLLVGDQRRTPVAGRHRRDSNTSGPYKPPPPAEQTFCQRYCTVQ